MDWSKGFSARYYAKEIDPVSWVPISSEIDILSGTVSNSTDYMRTSADIQCGDYDFAKERWIRVYLDAKQSGDSWSGALFTGLTSSPTISIEGDNISNSLTCYSVLKPESDIMLDRGWYVLAGTNAANILKSLLTFTPAPIEISDEDATISSTIIAEDGETHLTMVNKILDSINWRMNILGDGTINIGPFPFNVKTRIPTSVSGYIDSVNFDIFETQVNIENDWYSCPNVFRAVMDNSVAIARDDSEDSALSTVSRGREIWLEETGVSLTNSETLAEYAMRRLKEEQMISYLLSYNRRFVPELNIGDVISINYPKQNISGYFVIESQNITLGYGASVSEKVYML